MKRLVSRRRRASAAASGSTPSVTASGIIDPLTGSPLPLPLLTSAAARSNSTSPNPSNSASCSPVVTPRTPRAAAQRLGSTSAPASPAPAEAQAQAQDDPQKNSATQDSSTIDTAAVDGSAGTSGDQLVSTAGHSAQDFATTTTATAAASTTAADTRTVRDDGNQSIHEPLQGVTPAAAAAPGSPPSSAAMPNSNSGTMLNMLNATGGSKPVSLHQPTPMRQPLVPPTDGLTSPRAALKHSMTTLRGTLKLVSSLYTSVLVSLLRSPSTTTRTPQG